MIDASATVPRNLAGAIPPAAPEPQIVQPQSIFPWYALYVRSQQERIVESWLDQAGLPHFCPFVSKPRKPGPRTSNLERTEIPLLPGYVFTRVDVSQPVEIAGHPTPLVGLPGVVFIVGYGLTPEPIPDREVESLRILCRARVSMQSIPLVTAGDYVRVIRGPLAGAEGYVSWVKSPAGHQVPRITVSLGMLGRSVSAELDGDWLEKATDGAGPSTARTPDLREGMPDRRAGR